MAQAVAPTGARGPATAGGGYGAAAAAQAAVPNKWLVLITVVFGAFVAILDNTIVNTALPKLQAVFGAGIHESSYVATGYTLASGVVVPATGFLANRFGIKRVYLASLAAFTVGSALCGLSWSMGVLIVFRILQGAGGAALFPLAFAILFQAFPPEERGRANGFFGIPVLFAPAIGPTIGGYLVQYVDWRWIFYVNVPIGIAGLIIGLRILRESPPQRHLRFDVPGFVLAAAGFGLLLYGASNLAYDGWGSLLTVSGPLVAAAVLLVAWVTVELRVRQPLLNLRLFTQRNFLIGNLLTWIGTIGIFGPAFLLPQYLQNLRGLDPFPAGVLLFTSGVGTVFGTILAGNLYNRVGPRALIVGGGLVAIVTSFMLQGWSTLDSAYAVLPWILLLRGFGLPLVLQSATTSALYGITGRDLPTATTLNVVARNVVAALSIAILINVFDTQRVVHQANLAARVTRANPAANALYNGLVNHFLGLGLSARQAVGAAIGQLSGMVAQQGAALAFQDVYWLVGVVSIPVILLAFLVRAPRPAAGGGGASQAAIPRHVE